MSVTIAQIEDAILERLKSKELTVREFDVQKGVEGLVTPACYIAIDAGSFKRLSQSVFRQILTITLYIVFKHLKDEKERRRGIYPILEGVIGLLTMQTLDLDILPLTPKSFRNITDEDSFRAGLIAYQIEFETSYDVVAMSDDVAGELLKIGLNYYLKPGDEIPDASDLVTLRGAQ